MEDLNIEPCDSVPSDEEPKLLYHRMGNNIYDILLKDAISCIAIHPKFVCLGSEWGIVYVLDHEGNTVTVGSDIKSKDKVFSCHTIAVNNISVDLNGDFIATCSNDGKVNVLGLYSTDQNINLNLGKIIKSVALDPYYYKLGSSCRFLVGDNRLTLYEKNFFNRIKSTVLCECEGYVQAISWHDRFVAWAGDIGVRVFDIVARCSLGLIKWDNSKIVSADYQCNLFWTSQNVLMIGWVDTVRICAVKKRRHIDLQTKSLPEYIVDPMYTFPTDYYICGLAPFDSQLIILGFSKEPESNTGKAQRPLLNILDYKDREFFELSTDTLNMRGYEEYSCNVYHLACVCEENRFFIVSPKDIVIASQYDTDDRVHWLLKHEHYEKAMNVLENAGGKTSKYTLADVGISYLDYMLKKEKYEQAAELYSKVCLIDRTLWEKLITKFININCSKYICPYIPTSSDKRLSCQIYGLILREHLKLYPQEFLHLIKTWDPTLYNLNIIITAVIEQLLIVDADKNIYLEALGVLYCHQKKYDKALSMYLKLQHEDVFKLIKEHNLYDFIHDKILALMKLDCDKAISMLVDKTKVPTEIVEEQLRSSDFYLFKYLDSLNRIDNSGKYHGTLVRLYADYAREKLLPFLRKSDNYPIQDALDICKTKDYYPETVYLLGRIGSTKEALDIIIRKLKDINQAISFCQEHDDKELWMDLINYSLDKPEFITLLLKRIGNYVDPTNLIQGIKSDCEIHDLKDSLGKMMRDFNLQLSVQEACKAITFRNYFDLHEKLIKNHHKGMRISDDYVCSACHEKIIIKDLSHATDMIVYYCRHTFHTECLNHLEYLKQNNICALCNPIKTE